MVLTTSMCICLNLEFGDSKVSVGDFVCRVIFHHWHCLVYWVQFLFIPGYTKRSVMNFFEAVVPGCNKQCRLLKICRRQSFGTYGRTVRVAVLQYTSTTSTITVGAYIVFTF